MARLDDRASGRSELRQLERRAARKPLWRFRLGRRLVRSATEPGVLRGRASVALYDRNAWHITLEGRAGHHQRGALFGLDAGDRSGDRESQVVPSVSPERYMGPGLCVRADADGPAVQRQDP